MASKTGSISDISSIKYDSLPVGYVNMLGGASPEERSLEKGVKRSMFSANVSGRVSGAIYRSGQCTDVQEDSAFAARYRLRSTDDEKKSDQELSVNLLTDEFLQESGIEALENVLSNHYGKPCTITNIRLLDNCKHKKEVRFMVDNYLSQVWVFKANPATTSREMIAYEIAHKYGVPTGFPIGYMPKHEQYYPYDIAIIGGIVEHSRESFDSVIEGLGRKPAMIFNIAKLVGKMISGYQEILTNHTGEFEGRGVSLDPFDIESILSERLYRGLGIDSSSTSMSKSKLTGLVKELYCMQRSPMVVSECDTHTGQIIPIAKLNDTTGQIDTHLEQFGIVDWDMIGFDYPFADAVDFWVHLQRKTGKHEKMDFQKYLESFAADSGKINDLREGYIQKAWWDLIEIADPGSPNRKTPEDIAQKKRYHYSQAMEALSWLRKNGISTTALVDELERVIGPRI